MLFTEARFLLFFVIVLAVTWSLPGNRARKRWLLLCSYAFYAAWDWRFLGLIAASTQADFVAGRRIADARTTGARRAWLAMSLCVNLGLLGLFKYWDFFVTSGAGLLHALGLDVSPRTLGLILPVGISFYTFQTLSYSLDVYARRMAPHRDRLDFALFVGFFPQLVAGPIVRAIDFLPQLAVRPTWAGVAVRAQLWLFLAGFVKKACISDNVAPMVDALFAQPEAYGAGALWLGSVLYALQIYCDFSGYSDMAIATAGLLGYRLSLNFDFPYLARSITTFWRRWHISLSSWFRDYVYVPLGGNRRGPWRTYANLLLVFLLCGMWHGAAWRFVVWGLWHGVFLAVERALRGVAREPRERVGVGSVLRHAYVAGVVLVGWVFFRATDLSTALEYLRGMFSTGPLAGLSPQAVPAVAWWWVGAGAFLAVHVATRRRLLAARVAALPDAGFAVLYGAAVAAVLPWLPTDYAPFIYFQF
ncbi:MAG: MBOAT family O-acyltransferase [Planctomycetota bacterium]|jgi:alginate O-acetyltransferase complex protein AlgI